MKFLSIKFSPKFFLRIPRLGNWQPCLETLANLSKVLRSNSDLFRWMTFFIKKNFLTKSEAGGVECHIDKLAEIFLLKVRTFFFSKCEKLCFIFSKIMFFSLNFLPDMKNTVFTTLLQLFWQNLEKFYCKVQETIERPFFLKKFPFKLCSRYLDCNFENHAGNFLLKFQILIMKDLSDQKIIRKDALDKYNVMFRNLLENFCQKAGIFFAHCAKIIFREASKTFFFLKFHLIQLEYSFSAGWGTPAKTPKTSCSNSKKIYKSLIWSKKMFFSRKVKVDA